MDSIDKLDERLTALERQILPSINTEHIELIEQSQCIADMLLQAQAMLKTALSCRDIITTLLQKMEKLNNFLDPYCENDVDVEVKQQYILEQYACFKEYANDLITFHKLKDIPSSKNLDKSLELMTKLDTATVNNVNLHLESIGINTNVLEYLQQVINITTSLKRLFAELEMSVTAAELAIQQESLLKEE